MKNKIKYTIIAAFVAIIALAIFMLSSTNDDSNGETITTGIVTRVVPTRGTVITIDGKAVKEGGVTLEPGSYNVTVSRDGFASETRQATVQEGQVTTVAVILDSNAPETANWYTDNPSDTSKAEGIAGQIFEAETVTRANSLPILKRLPKTVLGKYTISYDKSLKKPNDPTAATIYIDYFTPAGKTAAENWIRYQGYNPAELEIVYRAKESE